MQTIYLDISNKGVIPTIYAKQGDVGRKFQVVLTDSGLPYVPIGGSAFSVWYSGASGEGNYTDIDDRSAFTVTGNKVIVEMISQMLSNDGDGVLSLVLNDPNGNQISTWNIPYVCEFVPGIDSEAAERYYTAFSNAVQNLPYPDASLSVAGKAADAAAVGAGLAGKAPAIEDGNNPGCFYRLVQGVTEWLNPPVVPGVEYRTTERHNGKAVYTKLVDCGALPNASGTTITASDTNALRVVSAIGTMTNADGTGGRVFPYETTNSTFGKVSMMANIASNGNVALRIETTSDVSSYNAYVTLKYTKRS